MFKKENRITLIFILIMAILIAVGVLGYMSKDEKAQPATDSFPIQTNTTMAFDYNKQPRLGSIDAPVQLIEFFDYNCPHCQEWHKTIFPIIKEKYIDKGYASLISVNYAFMQDTSSYAAIAGEVMYEKYPDKYEVFKGRMLTDAASFKTLNPTYIGEVAAELSPFTSEEFINEMKKPHYQDHVLSDKQQGIDMGVTGTPSLFINGEKVTNPGDLEAIDALIKEAIENEKS